MRKDMPNGHPPRNQSTPPKLTKAEAEREEMKPVKGSEHFALKKAMFVVLQALGVQPARRSLAAITTEAVARAKVITEAGKNLSSFNAYVDGAIDAITHGKPDDLERAKQLLARATRELELAAVAAQNDAKKQLGG